MDCFLDVGSNIGYYSLLASLSNPNLKSYAFEPAMGPKYFLQKNIELNSFNSSIKAIDLALSEKNGQIEFYEVENKKYKYLKHNLAGEGNAGTKTKSRNFIKNLVQTTTLDDFVKQENLQKIDLLKIDTEGTEINILKTGRDAILKFQPIIICETLYDTIEDELDYFFNELDYTFFNHTSVGLKKTISLKRESDDGIRNCFFVPKSKLDLISKFVIK
jgi:FkbM family methyltransferase